jgi:hypothetical protein
MFIKFRLFVRVTIGGALTRSIELPVTDPLPPFVGVCFRGSTLTHSTLSRTNTIMPAGLCPYSGVKEGGTELNA